MLSFHTWFLVTSFHASDWKIVDIVTTYMLGEEISSAGPIHILYCSKQINYLDFHVKVQLEIIIE